MEKVICVNYFDEDARVDVSKSAPVNAMEDEAAKTKTMTEEAADREDTAVDDVDDDEYSSLGDISFDQLVTTVRDAELLRNNERFTKSLQEKRHVKF